MAKIKRTAAINLMEALGFHFASALSTGRLQKKINRIDRVVSEDHELDDDDMDDLFQFVMESIKSDDKIVVVEDRPNIPNVDNPQAKLNELKRRDTNRFDAPKSKYNWSSILDGKIHELTQGEDYNCKSTNFALMAKTAAKKRGMRVLAKVEKCKVTLQAVEERK